eukprot:gene66833-91533_t
MFNCDFFNTIALVIFISCHAEALLLTSKKLLPSKQSVNRRIAWRMVVEKNEIDRINLGSSDLLVSKVCLGTMTWGQQNTEDEGIQQLNYAFNECGINFLDTAEMYPVPTKAETQGKTDLIISKWLKTVDRSKVILATKVAGFSDSI